MEELHLLQQLEQEIIDVMSWYVEVVACSTRIYSPVEDMTRVHVAEKRSAFLYDYSLAARLRKQDIFFHDPQLTYKSARNLC